MTMMLQCCVRDRALRRDCLMRDLETTRGMPFNEGTQ